MQAFSPYFLFGVWLFWHRRRLFLNKAALSVNNGRLSIELISF